MSDALPTFRAAEPGLKVGDYVQFNGERRQVVRVEPDGVTVTVSERHYPAPGKQTLIRPNRAMRRAAAARARRARR